MESLEQWLPFWPRLNEAQRKQLSAAARERLVPKGTLLHRGAEDCVGLMLVLEGQLRVYTLSEEGKELTLYRLLERDLCLFSASCLFHSIQFDVLVSAERDTRVIHIPAEVYRSLMEESAAVAGYTNELMASRFSDVMWLMDQILNKKLDARLAAFLLEERELTGSAELSVTHEQIGTYLGSAREVVTRMLRYFQAEGLVRLGRGSLLVLDEPRLEKLAAGSRR